MTSPKSSRAPTPPPGGDPLATQVVHPSEELFGKVPQSASYQDESELAPLEEHSAGLPRMRRPRRTGRRLRPEHQVIPPPDPDSGHRIGHLISAPQFASIRAGIFSRLAISNPSAKPNRANCSIPLKSQSARYSSLGWWYRAPVFLPLLRRETGRLADIAAAHADRERRHALAGKRVVIGPDSSSRTPGCHRAESSADVVPRRSVRWRRTTSVPRRSGPCPEPGRTASTNRNSDWRRSVPRDRRIVGKVLRSDQPALLGRHRHEVRAAQRFRLHRRPRPSHLHQHRRSPSHCRWRRCRCASPCTASPTPR